MFESIDYLILLTFMVLAFIISKIILNLSYLLIPQEINLDKMTGYECGYDPFEDARGSFNVQFYLVSILFLIFDLEIAFLFPWSVTLSSVGFFGFLMGYLFLIFLSIGFIFEYKKGALYW